MRTSLCFLTASFLIVLACSGSLFSQSAGGNISGILADQNNAVISGATVTAKNTATGFTRSSVTNSEGRYSFTDVPIGAYELTIEAPNFTKYVRTGVNLLVNQNAIVSPTLTPGSVNETVTVNSDASLLNTTTSEVATRFDERRLSELPISPNRNVFNIVLSVPGVAQLGGGQASYATGISFSSNGGRIRSNNFMIDGQDVNDTVFAGTGFALNNPDAIQEVRIVTNQFKAEYGRNSGSVVNFVGKSGTNDYHGTLFWFHNNEYLNACSNLDKVASFGPTGFCNGNAVTDERKRAPKRLENQFGLTFGGPFTFLRFGDGGDSRFWKGTDKTFIFGDYQRWSDRSQRSGATLTGAPTANGRAVLQSIAASRPQVQALLNFVPAGTANGRSASFTIPGQQPRSVELGNFTGSSPFIFDDRQGSVRVDHRFNDENLIYGRYRFDLQRTTGAGQVTPPGHTTVNSTRSAAATIVVNSIITTKLSNEARISWSLFSSMNDAEDPSSKTIPSIAVPGLQILNISVLGNANRTAIGLPSTLPGARRIQAYQISDASSYFVGNHNIKFGIELRRTDARILAFQNSRGRLQYNSPPSGDISNFVNDIASEASINFPLAGGSATGFFRWHELYAFAQDEWRIRNEFTVTYGIRYEYPGDSFGYLREVNERILAANGNDPAFRSTPTPKADTNNFMPRIGFNWNPRTGGEGLLGLVTGGDKVVVRGGYSRTYDANFANINANMFYSFPFAWTENVSLIGAFAAMQNATAPNVSQPNRVSRIIVSEHLRAPATDQISFEIQRELAKDLLVQVGYIRTRGTGLLQIVDGNPCRPGLNCRGAFGNRVDPNREVIQLYTNAASSTYDALQASLTKRLSNNFSAGLHYTWSTFIDDASDIFSPSVSENSVAQDPFDRRADRARSSYDRPHRLTGNFVYEFPFYRRQDGVSGRLFGGWQVNSFFTFQSGAPFSVSLGSDPACALCGIVASVRPNLNTNLDLSSMSISEILAAGGSTLFRGLAPGQRVGDAGRNIIRADGIGLVDLGITKNTRVTERIRLQIRADLFNAFNRRNFGIPPNVVSSPGGFLNQWATDGGNRRVRLGARFVF